MDLTLPILTAGLLGLAAAGGAVGSAPADERLADREAIRAHIDQIFHAYMRRDRATVRATHSADWRGFIRPSRGVVRGIDQYMREAEGILSAPGRLKGYEMVEFDVLFRGDVALVPYVARIEWVEEGTVHPDLLRVLDVYAKEDGHWNQVASQVATHPDALLASRQQPRTLRPSEKALLLAEREKVWRAYFAGDVETLGRIMLPETLTINAGGEEWKGREAVLAAARAFAAGGGRLVRLEFPRTEVQAFGDLAVLYTTYVYEVDSGGTRSTQSGRGTEVFVWRDGRWVHPGWHLDSGR